MGFPSIAAQAAADSIRCIGESVTLVGADAGRVSTHAVIQSRSNLLGDIGEMIWTCTLLKAVAGDARRGDRVIAENRDEWELQERDDPSSRYVETWTVTKL